MDATLVTFLTIGGIILMGVIGVLAGKNVEVDNGKLSISSGGRKKKPPHAICGHSKDVVRVFRDRDDCKDRISEIENRLLPKEIMQTSEDAIEQIMAALTGYYLSLLREKNIAAKEDVAGLPQFKLYTIILEAIRPYLIQECRRMMHENGWIKKENDGVFDNYVKQKTLDFITYFTTLLNDYYIIEKPTRIEVYEWNRFKLNEPNGITSIVELTLRQYLVIARNWKKEVDILKAKMDADMKILLGD